MNEPSAPQHLASQGVVWARVRLARYLGRMAIGSAAGALVTGSVAAAFGAYGIGRLVGSSLFLMIAPLLLASFAVWFRRTPLPGEVTFDAHGLDVLCGATRRRIDRTQIASAYAVARYVRGGVAPTVELELAGGDLVSFEVTSEEVALRVVDDLGFGRGKKRIRISLGSPARRLYHLFLGVVAYYVGSLAALPILFASSTMTGAQPMFGGLVSAAVMVGMYAFLRGLLRAPEVTIGDDGVLYRSGRKRRFLPGAAITAVEQPSVALPLLLRSDRENPLAIHGSALDFDRRTAVARLAYERFVGPAAPAAGDDLTAAQFARGGRTLEAWREHLRAHANDVGYREAARPVDVAAAVLHSPRSTNDERVGAALAMRVAGEPPERIRVAASAAADEHLRVALETIADDDDDAVLDRALRKVR